MREEREDDQQSKMSTKRATKEEEKRVDIVEQHSVALPTADEEAIN